MGGRGARSSMPAGGRLARPWADRASGAGRRVAVPAGDTARS